MCECPNCLGTGSVWSELNFKFETCTICQGIGEISDENQDDFEDELFEDYEQFDENKHTPDDE